MTSSKKFLLLASCALFALAACSGNDDGRVAGQVPASHALDGPTSMTAALPMAGAHGIDNTYFNAELQDAMQRVQSMRSEMETLNSKLSALQDRLSGVGAEAGIVPSGTVSSVPASFPGAPVQSTTTTTTTSETVPATATIDSVAAPADGPIAVGPTAMTTQPVTTQTTQTTTTSTAPATTSAPTSITGAMAKPTVADTKAEPMKPVVEAAKKDAKKTAAAPTASASAKDGVNAVRFGTHGDTVRVVLDVKGSAEGAKPELDTANSIMTITLPKTAWSAVSTQKVANNPLVASYSAQPNGDGSVVAFSLKGATKIVSSSVMKNPTRVVVDIAK